MRPRASSSTTVGTSRTPNARNSRPPSSSVSGRAEKRPPGGLSTALARLVHLPTAARRLVLHYHDQELRGLRLARILRDAVDVIRPLVKGPSGTKRLNG